MSAINVENATVYLSGREILHNISWQVSKGERCFILGANGAGKTTLVRMLMGYAWPLFGATVEILGHLMCASLYLLISERIFCTLLFVEPSIEQCTQRITILSVGTYDKSCLSHSYCASRKRGSP